MSFKECKYRAVLIFGPTAVGKTAFLQHFINHISEDNTTSLILPVEVISADSRQIYQGFNISTAYPSSYLLSHIPHHLIGCKHYTESYTVFDFVEDAHKLIAEISERGHCPLVVGGAAFYLYHLCMGIPQTPQPNTAVRTQLQQQLQQKGQLEMFTRLKSVDPIYANQIAATDSYRTIRALEVYLQTGIPLSSVPKHTSVNNIEFLVYGLSQSRERLYHNINVRVDEMCQQGLVQEVYVLWKLGLTLEHNAGKTIGVQEFLSCNDVIQAWQKDMNIDPHTLNAILALIKRNSRRYAKRQDTFFKKIALHHNVKWCPLDQSSQSDMHIESSMINDISQFFPTRISQ